MEIAISEKGLGVFSSGVWGVVDGSFYSARSRSYLIPNKLTEANMNYKLSGLWLRFLIG